MLKSVFFFLSSECRIKLQLVLIKEKALSKISEFKVSKLRINSYKFDNSLCPNQAKDQATNEEMERWIGECYKQKVEW